MFARTLVVIVIITSPISLLDVVALTEPLPQYGLLAGQVGTIVELLAPDVFEIEFSDDSGKTYAQVPVKRGQILPLHFPGHSEQQHNSPRVY